MSDGPWGGARWGSASPEERKKIKRRNVAGVIGAAGLASAAPVLGKPIRSKLGVAGLAGGGAVGAGSVLANRRDVKQGKVVVGKSAFGVDHGGVSKAKPQLPAKIREGAKLLSTKDVHNSARNITNYAPQSHEYVMGRHLENVTSGAKRLRNRSLAVGGVGAGTTAGGGGYAIGQRRKKRRSS